MASSTPRDVPPLVARSPDGSLVALHQPGGTTVRCYGGDAASGGSLRFTLRVPGAGVGGGGGDAGSPASPAPAVRKLVFASSGTAGGGGGESPPPPTLLCAVAGRSTVVLFDLGRGVASQTVDVREGSGDTKGKKSKKKSKKEADAEVADASSSPGRLDVLVRLPDADGGGPGKCRLYQYDLPGGGDGRRAARLVRKVRIGSAPADGSSAAVASCGGGTTAVRLGGRVRTFDGGGNRTARFDLPDELLLADGAEGGGGGDADRDGISPLLWDGSRLVASSGRRVLVMSQRGGEDGTAPAIEAEELLEADAGAGPTTSLDARGADLVAFSGGSGTASVFSLGVGAREDGGGGGELKPVPPRATARIDASAGTRASLVSAGLARRRGGEGGGEVQFLFRNAGGAAGSAASLPAETLGVAGLVGEVAVGSSLAGEEGKDRKRKQRAGGGVALAPGEQGQEADGAADLTSAKRARRGEEGEEEKAKDAEGEDADDDDEKERSIAERLAMLSSAMERSDTEDDDEDDDDPQGGGGAPSSAAGFRARSATSATLTALLSQALGSGDPAQLNAALQVTDRRVVAGTVRSLQALDAARDVGDGEDGGEEDGDAPPGGLVPALMGHIVRRVARRHTLVMPLGVWIREVLAATARAAVSSPASSSPGRMAEDARDMAAKLGPLRNFLSERVECLPQLLRLEGRLALLGDQQL